MDRMFVAIACLFAESPGPTCLGVRILDDNLLDDYPDDNQDKMGTKF